MKFGKLSRARDSRVPHMAALMAGRRSALAPIPASCDYSSPLAPDLGALGNLTVGNCTSCGQGHAIQAWTYWTSGKSMLITDSEALQNYTECTGWDGTAGDATDTGCVEQDALKHWLQTGFPLDGGQRDLLHSFFEADPASYDQLARGIYECGVVYVGFTVPTWLTRPGDLPAVWDLHGGDLDAPSGEGHCVTLYGYAESDGVPMLRLNSWGKWYWMTMRMAERCMDEAYALVSPDFCGRPGGVDPLNMTLADLDAQMAALRSS